MGRKPYPSLRDRLEANSTKAGCWLWTGTANNKGYGMLNISYPKKGAVKRLAHRVSYEQFVGPIPEGLCVLHKCDVPRCINPDHLWLGTKADNNRDMQEKGRKSHGERHYKAKLTDEKVLMILRSEKSSTVLSSELGVGARHIRSIRERKEWRHIGGQTSSPRIA